MCIHQLSARPRIVLFREALTYARLSRAPLLPRSFFYTPARTFQMDQSLLHTCDIDAEPLHRYRKGGYHPVHIGDVLNDGRYKILHKLGWGSYSTVWATRDQRFRFSLYFDIY